MWLLCMVISTGVSQSVVEVNEHSFKMEIMFPRYCNILHTLLYKYYPKNVCIPLLKGYSAGKKNSLHHSAPQ